MAACPFCGKVPSKAPPGKRLRCGGCKGIYKLPKVEGGRALPVEGPAQFKRPQAKGPSAFSPRRIIGGLAGLVPILAIGAAGWWWYNNYTKVKEARQFNDRIVDAHDAISAKFDRCLDALDFAVEAKDPYDLKKAAGELGEALDDGERAARNLAAPDMQEALAYVRAFQSAVGAYRLWLDRDLAAAIASIGRGEEPTAGRAAFEQVRAGVVADLEKAQRALAARYKLELR